MKTRAVLGCAALALCLVAGPAKADDVPVSDNARQHFKTGVSFLQDPDGARYEEAYREFKAAYADSPSWKILGNLGITAMKLERDGEAVDAFERYLAAGGAQIDPSERAQMERDLMTTKAGLVWVSVRVEPTVASITDERLGSTGRAVSNYYTLGQDGTVRVGVRSGRHRMTARATGFQDQVWDFEASPGPELTREFRLEKPTAAPVPVT